MNPMFFVVIGRPVVEEIQRALVGRLGPKQDGSCLVQINVDQAVQKVWNATFIRPASFRADAWQSDPPSSHESA